jgi:aminopeptidase-like protein
MLMNFYGIGISQICARSTDQNISSIRRFTKSAHEPRIASETIAFDLFLASQKRQQNGHLLIGKVFWQSQTARECFRSAFLAHPEISNEKI